jgi:OmpA-OmpF porin, OOP family
MRKSFLYILLFLLIALKSQAQEIMQAGSFENRLEYANELYERRSYFSAIEAFKLLQKEFPKHEEVAYKLAMSYYEASSYEEARAAFEHFTSLKKLETAYPLGYYFYAKSLMALGAYTEAQKTFLLFAQASRKNNDPELIHYKRQFKSELRSCEYALELETNHQKHLLKVEVAEGLNSGYSDFSPIYIKEDSILFASLNSNKIIETENGAENTPKVKLFGAKKQKGEWQQIQEANLFNDPLAHTANGAFSHDKKEFYFSRCYEDERFGKKCDIYVSEFRKGKWKKPRKLGRKVNQSRYSSSQPATGRIRYRRKEYTVLYFVSDRPDGYGGKDIWFALIDLRGRIEQVQNCGSGINGKGDEVTPYYDEKEQMMYFSSDSHWGAGGLDIFKSLGHTRSWRRAENMGIPINSSYDDLYYSPKPGKTNGFLVSNRPGSTLLEGNLCCEDIFTFEAIEPKEFQIAGHWISDLPDSMVDKTALKIGIIPSLERETHQILGDSLPQKMQEQMQWLTSSDSAGKFSFELTVDQNYALVATAQHHHPKVLAMDSIVQQNDSESLYLILEMKALQEAKPIPVIKETEPVIVSTETVSPKKSLTKNTKVEDLENEESLVLNNIYFELDEHKIRKESLLTLDILLDFMKRNPTVRIEVAGHTDNSGDDTYNLNLSQRRAESIKKHLVDKGIEESRIEAKGYGESQPLIPNLTKENQRLNRRIEVKIIPKS